MKLLFAFWALSSIWASDYDVVIVGSSPFCILEALYQDAMGKRVLLVEEQDRCGGAWKTIDICGVSNVDMGCHDIGSNREVQQFLEEVLGCTLVSLENPLIPFDPTKEGDEYYFSRGCAEFIENLERLLSQSRVAIQTATKVEAVVETHSMAYIHINRGVITAHKVIGTPKTFFCMQEAISAKTESFFHLYMLLQDPTAPCFTHRNMEHAHIRRLMNMTYFVGMQNTGRQLIIVQTRAEKMLGKPQELLDVLKAEHLVAPEAFLLQAEPYIYEVQFFPRDMKLCDCIEILDTENFISFTKHIAKWRQAIRPKVK